MIRLGQAMRATQPIPPNVVGHDPDFKGGAQYDVAGAKALLDKFGYVDRDGDGWRDMPDGKPLKLDARLRSVGDLPPVRRAVEEEHGRGRHPDRVHQAEISRHAEAGARGAAADVGPRATPTRTTTAAASSTSCTARTRGCRTSGASTCPSSTRSTTARRSCPTARSACKLYREMSKLVVAYAPWVLHTYRIENIIVHPWVRGLQVQHVRPASVDVSRPRPARSASARRARPPIDVRIVARRLFGAWRAVAARRAGGRRSPRPPTRRAGPTPPKRCA